MTNARSIVLASVLVSLAVACGSAAPSSEPEGTSEKTGAAPRPASDSTPSSSPASPAATPSDPSPDDGFDPTDPTTFVGDLCGDILVSLANGFAEGSVGLANTEAIHVVLNEETYRRVYTITIDGKSFEANGKTFPNDYFFDVTLDNDIHSMCYLNSASLRSVAREAGTDVEIHENFSANATLPIATPSADPCSTVLKHLSRAVTLSAVGTRSVETDVTSDGETDVRDYKAHIDGKNFSANGKEFANDHDFAISLNNDSASKCLPLAIAYRE